MGFPVVSDQVARKDKKRKVTCTTCGFKKCVGRCRWERVENPRRKKAA